MEALAHHCWMTTEAILACFMREERTVFPVSLLSRISYTACQSGAFSFQVLQQRRVKHASEAVNNWNFFMLSRSYLKCNEKWEACYWMQ
ncbi:unnamed protein product [Urochloa humidicola]